MRLVTIDSKYLTSYTEDKEMLHKAKRPCVLVVRLLFRKHRYDFAVPLRSNINPSTPKRDYFPLPPRSSTQKSHYHGIHYAKMFPVRKDMLLPFHTGKSASSKLLKSIIDKNEQRIVRECQEYLERYENGDIPLYATDIDFLITKL